MNAFIDCSIQLDKTLGGTEMPLPSWHTHLHAISCANRAVCMRMPSCGVHTYELCIRFIICSHQSVLYPPTLLAVERVGALNLRGFKLLRSETLRPETLRSEPLRSETRSSEIQIVGSDIQLLGRL